MFPLAAALSVPLLLSDGHAFPHRNLILFITFIVILVTLVFQGLSLPWLIRKLDVKDKHAAFTGHEQEKMIQKKITQLSLQYLEKKFSSEGLQNEHLKDLQSRLETEMDFFNHEVEEAENARQNSRSEYQQIYIELLEHQRKLLEDINQHAEFDEDIIRKYQSLVDLEEYKVQKKYSVKTAPK